MGCSPVSLQGRFLPSLLDQRPDPADQVALPPQILAKAHEPEPKMLVLDLTQQRLVLLVKTIAGVKGVVGGLGEVTPSKHRGLASGSVRGARTATRHAFRCPRSARRAGGRSAPSGRKEARRASAPLPGASGG